MLIHQVLLWDENGLDFADGFHLAPSQNREKFYTFVQILNLQSPSGAGKMPAAIAG